MAQQGDVKLVQTNNDGDIDIVNGIVNMSGGLETAVYLSLFGGGDWWGNTGEVLEKQYNSKTQKLLDELPATSSNLLRIEDVIRLDLNWLIEQKISSSIDVNITIPKLNSIDISITIEANGIETNFNFTENWKAND